jgi:hypothetical protein
MAFYCVFDKDTLEYKYSMAADSQQACLPDEVAYEIEEQLFDKIKVDILTPVLVNNVVRLDIEDSVQAKKENMVRVIKNIANKKIRTFNNKTYTQEQWIMKSQNFQDCKSSYCIKLFTNIRPSDQESERYTFACKMLDRKDRYVNRIHQIEQDILNMTENQLNEFNPNDEKLWDGVEEG